MTEQEFIKLLPLFRGELKTVREALKPYTEISAVDIGCIRKILGLSGPSTHKLSTEQIEAMVEEFKEGDTSLHKLAKKYGVDVTSVRGVLTRRHVDTSYKDAWSPIKKRRFIEMRKKGYSYTAIGKMFGISVSAASQQGRRLGFPGSNTGMNPFVQVFDPFANKGEK